MAAMKFRLLTWPLLFVLLLQTYLLLLAPVLCDDAEENNLLQGLNSYRTSLQLPPLTKNKQAGCLADEIADKMEDHPCTPTVAASAIPANTGPTFLNYPKLLKKCKIDPNTTGNGVILPVCVSKLVPTLVLTNYTRTAYARYINDSKFTSAGLGSEDDWMVVVLATSAPAGTFAANTVNVVHGIVNLFLPLLAGLFLV